MIGLGNFLKSAGLIRKYNISTSTTGLRLSVLGKKINAPDGADEWISTIKDTPTYTDLRDLYLGTDELVYKKLTK